MQVYLFRHGQTAGNAENRYLGATDEPLCELGIETAKAAGSDPNVSEILVSPLQRARMTAAILFPNARQLVCNGFREMNFGDFEGRSYKDMENDPDYRYWVEVTRCFGPCPHGDAMVVFQHRVCAVFLREVKKALEAGQERLYILAHGGVIMSILYRFAEPPAPYYDWPLDNCQGYRCEVSMGAEGLKLRDVCHLEKVSP